MNKVEQFIEKLEKLTFISVAEDRKTLISNRGFELSYTTSFQSLIGSREDCRFIGLPIQLIFHVRYNGEHVMSWGCDELEDTITIAKWYKLKLADLQRATDDQEIATRNEGRAIFDSL